MVNRGRTGHFFQIRKFLLNGETLTIPALFREFKALRVWVDGSDVSLVDNCLAQWAANLNKEARWS